MEVQERKAENSSSNSWSAYSRKVPTNFRSKPDDKKGRNPSYRLFPVVESTPIVSRKVCRSLMALSDSRGEEKQQPRSMDSGICRPQTASDTTMMNKESDPSANALIPNLSSRCMCSAEETGQSSPAQSMTFPKSTRVKHACAQQQSKRPYSYETSVRIEDRPSRNSADSGPHGSEVVSNAKALHYANGTIGERRATQTVSKEVSNSRMAKWMTSVKRVQGFRASTPPRQTAECKRVPILSSARPKTAPHEAPHSNNLGVLESLPRVDTDNVRDVQKLSTEVVVASDGTLAFTKSLVHTLKDLIAQKQTLREEYLSLRAERTKLLDSINLVLRQTKPRTAHATILLDRVLSLSMLVISMDVCFYRMKATYFRQDAAVEELLSRVKLGEVGIVGRSDEIPQHPPCERVYEVARQHIDSSECVPAMRSCCSKRA